MLSTGDFDQDNDNAGNLHNQVVSNWLTMFILLFLPHTVIASFADDQV